MPNFPGTSALADGGAAHDAALRVGMAPAAGGGAAGGLGRLPRPPPPRHARRLGLHRPLRPGGRHLLPGATSMAHQPSRAAPIALLCRPSPAPPPPLEAWALLGSGQAHPDAAMHRGDFTSDRRCANTMQGEGISAASLSAHMEHVFTHTLVQSNVYILQVQQQGRSGRGRAPGQSSGPTRQQRTAIFLHISHATCCRILCSQIRKVEFFVKQCGPPGHWRRCRCWVGQGFLAEGLQRTSAGLGSVIIDSQPLSVAVLASVLFGESLSVLGYVGLLLGIAGLLLLEVPQASLEAFLHNPGGTLCAST